MNIDLFEIAMGLSITLMCAGLAYRVAMGGC